MIFQICITGIGLACGCAAALVYGVWRNDPRVVGDMPDWARDL